MSQWRLGRVSRAVRRGAVIGGAALALCCGSAAQGASERLAITAAVWKAEKAELRIEGRSRHVDSVVLVRDVATKKLIGSAAVRSDGKWMLKIRDPNFIPKRTRAECDGARDECAVQAVAEVATAQLPQGGPSPLQ